MISKFYEANSSKILNLTWINLQSEKHWPPAAASNLLQLVPMPNYAVMNAQR